MLTKILMFLLFVNCVFADELTFHDYCMMHNTDLEILKTVEVIKKQVGGTNCKETFKLLNNLEILDLKDQGLIDLAPLRGAYKLRELNLSWNEIENIDPLADFKTLTTLDLSHNLLFNGIDKLSELVLLEKLLLNSNEIEDIAFLSKMVALKELGIGNNFILDLGPIDTLIELSTLFMVYNDITDLSPLIKLNKIKSIFLHGNPIEKNIEKCPFGQGVPIIIDQFCRNHVNNF